jgi:hypothetical protein
MHTVRTVPVQGVSVALRCLEIKSFRSSIGFVRAPISKKGQRLLLFAIEKCTPKVLG